MNEKKLLERDIDELKLEELDPEELALVQHRASLELVLLLRANELACASLSQQIDDDRDALATCLAKTKQAHRDLTECITQLQHIAEQNPDLQLTRLIPSLETIEASNDQTAPQPPSLSSEPPVTAIKPDTSHEQYNKLLENDIGTLIQDAITQAFPSDLEHLLALRDACQELTSLLNEESDDYPTMNTLLEQILQKRSAFLATMNDADRLESLCTRSTHIRGQLAALQQCCSLMKRMHTYLQQPLSTLEKLRAKEKSVQSSARQPRSKSTSRRKMKKQTEKEERLRTETQAAAAERQHFENAWQQGNITTLYGARVRDDVKHYQEDVDRMWEGRESPALIQPEDMATAHMPQATQEYTDEIVEDVLPLLRKVGADQTAVVQNGFENFIDWGPLAKPTTYDFLQQSQESTSQEERQQLNAMHGFFYYLHPNVLECLLKTICSKMKSEWRTHHDFLATQVGLLNTYYAKGRKSKSLRPTAEIIDRAMAEHTCVFTVAATMMSMMQSRNAEYIEQAMAETWRALTTTSCYGYVRKDWMVFFRESQLFKGTFSMDEWKEKFETAPEPTLARHYMEKAALFPAFAKHQAIMAPVRAVMALSPKREL